MALREPTLDDVFLELTGHPAEEPTDDDDDATPRAEASGADGAHDDGSHCTTTARGLAAARNVTPRPVTDALTMAWRNLLNIRRNPQLLVFATIQPIIFVLMFRYVFGGAIGHCGR